MKTFYQYPLSAFSNGSIKIPTSNYNLCKIGIQKPYSFDHFSVTEKTEDGNGSKETNGTIPPSVTIKYFTEFAKVAEDGSVSNEQKEITQDFHITRRWCLEHSNIYVNPKSEIEISVNGNLKMPKEFLLDLELSEI